MSPTFPIEAVFLDRDGVINQDRPDYVKSLKEFRLIEGSLKALALLARHNLPVFVITNQSAIGRGIITPDTLKRIHREMLSRVEKAGGRIRDIFFCPHRPDENCPCRKPKPGLIRQAADKYGLNLGRTVMIGDNAKDIQAARAAGCGLALLVRTGNLQDALARLEASGQAPDRIFNNLLEAVNWLLGLG